MLRSLPDSMSTFYTITIHGEGGVHFRMGKEKGGEERQREGGRGKIEKEESKIV